MIVSQFHHIFVFPTWSLWLSCPAVYLFASHQYPFKKDIGVVANLASRTFWTTLKCCNSYKTLRCRKATSLKLNVLVPSTVHRWGSGCKDARWPLPALCPCSSASQLCSSNQPSRFVARQLAANQKPKLHESTQSDSTWTTDGPVMEPVQLPRCHDQFLYPINY